MQYSLKGLQLFASSALHLTPVMKLFPTNTYAYTLAGEPEAALERLERRTELSERLTSIPTDKSFRGMINGTGFRIISSAIGRGAFSVMSGAVDSKIGVVKVEINNVFKVLLSILLYLPVVVLGVQLARGENEMVGWSIVAAILQVLIIRFVFIELVFKYLSKESFRRLSDVLDVE